MNLLRVLEELGIKYKSPGESKHVNHGWVGIICPHCGGGTNNYGMGINTSSLACTCWKCGKHRLFSTLKIATKVPFHRVSEVLGTLRAERPVERTLGALKTILPPGIGQLESAHRQFLRSRGFTPTKIEEVWKVQGIGQTGGRYAWSLFIPALLGGEVVSWTTRGVGMEKRYDSAPAESERVPIKSILYGGDLCSHAVVCCEGPLDAWAIGPGGVATCGLGITALQVVALAAYPVRVVCFDNEEKAQRRAEEVCLELAPFPGETFNVCLSGKDASRSPKSEIEKLKRRFLK